MSERTVFRIVQSLLFTVFLVPVSGSLISQAQAVTIDKSQIAFHAQKGTFAFNFKNTKTGEVDYRLVFGSSEGSDLSDLVINANLDSNRLSVGDRTEIQGTLYDNNDRKIASASTNVKIGAAANQYTAVNDPNKSYLASKYDKNKNGFDDTSSGFVHVEFSNGIASLSSGLNLRMANVATGHKNASKWGEVLNAGAFSYYLGNLEAFNAADAFKSWYTLNAGNGVHFRGGLYTISGDIHLYGTTSSSGAAVPEPATVALLSSALIGLKVKRRKRV